MCELVQSKRTGNIHLLSELVDCRASGGEGATVAHGRVSEQFHVNLLET